MDEQNSQELIQAVQTLTRKVKRIVPDNEKDDRYWEKRKRNNMAAKRSRENKRFAEMSVRRKMRLLEEENYILRKEISVIKSRYGVPVDQEFLSEQEKAQCRSEVHSDGKVPYDGVTSRTDEVSSPVSTTSASVSTSPHRVTPELQYQANYPAEYPPPKPEPMERETLEESYPPRKRMTVSGRRPVRRSQVPQTLFYGSSYGAQLMWTSARSLNLGPLAGNMQQLYHEYSLNNEPVDFVGDEHPLSHPGHTSLYPSGVPRPNCVRPMEYSQGYKAPVDYTPVSYDIVPTDLSPLRDRYPDESTASREKHAEDDTVAQPKEQSSGNYDVIRKRRPSDEYVYGYSANCDPGLRHHESSGQSSAVHSPSFTHSPPGHWQESNRSSQDVPYVSRSDACYFDHRSTHHDDTGRAASSYSQQLPQAEESYELRRENEELKVRIRQLFSQVSKMKDIVLPD
ncbi:uncharacterized protein LOC135470931 [Liolophura sinensis]|uniref:uncharacterized protein LOC135470931 n=1 Tax=Liolophura sinensis TaxID=3198878 RepID=UPI003158AC62